MDKATDNPGRTTIGLNSWTIGNLERDLNELVQANRLYERLLHALLRDGDGLVAITQGSIDYVTREDWQPETVSYAIDPGTGDSTLFFGTFLNLAEDAYE